MNAGDADAQLKVAQALHAQGRLDEAEAAYAQVLAADPRNAHAWHLLGIVADQRGLHAEAATRYRRALNIIPGLVPAQNNLAVVLKREGRYDEATALLEQALAARPDYAEAALNLGLVREACRDLPGAEGAYRRALAARPDWTPALANLGTLLRRARRLDEADQCLSRHLALRPEDGDALGNMALLRLDQQRAHEARTLAQEAVRRSTGTSLWLETAGVAARATGDGDGAIPLLEEAVRLDPTNAEAWLELGLASQACGEDDRAQRAFAACRHLAPEDEKARWADCLRLPAMPRSERDVDEALARFDRGLDAVDRGLNLESSAERDAALETAASFVPFSLAYLRGDHTERQRRYAEIVARVAHAAYPWAQDRPMRRRGARLRVGFVSAYWREHVVARYFASFATGLPRDSFERWVWHTEPSGDATTARIAAAVDRFASIPGPLAVLARSIADASLDVLVYPDVGLDPRQLVLASLRLAPLQVALAGHPATTGLEGVDAFMSGEAVEGEGGQAHYVENLVRLPRLGASIARPPAPGDGAWATRLRNGPRPLALCLQNLIKLPPAFDTLLARIAAESHARIVFFDRGQRLSERFRQRIETAFLACGVDPRESIVLAPLRTRADFIAGIAAADLVLDTPNFSGGATSLDAFAAGTPVLCFDGVAARARQTAAMLRVMGMPELITQTDDYVARAVALLEDEEARRGLRQRILERHSMLFEDPAPVKAFADWLLGASC